MTLNRRRYRRFSATAFLNKPVMVLPLIPFFGEPLEGRIIDLSAGGMAVSIEMIIPQGTHIHLKATFPDRSRVECDAEVTHVLERNGHFLHGFEFVNLPVAMAARVEKMSMDFIDCESRLATGATDVCHTDCAFYSLCTKAEKVNPVVDSKAIMELSLQTLSKAPVAQATQPEI